MTTIFLSCNEAKEIDLVDYLSHLGFQPQKIIQEDYWYLSPLREEKHASFKVDRKKNIWYDFGTGEGGTIIDFDIRYHHCTISEFLDKLKSSFSFHQPHILHQSIPAGQKKKIALIAATSITNPALCRYLDDRKVPPDIARKYCKEVHYSLYGKHYFAIGFPNNSGGYELRNAYFKGCVAPKDVTTFVIKNAKEIGVFEGFFSFLSYLKIIQNQPEKTNRNFLILNSLSFFKKSREIMEKYTAIHLYLDRDSAGRKCTEDALKWSSKYKDCSGFYAQNKDLNEWLIQQENTNTLKANLQIKNKNKPQHQNLIQRSGNVIISQKKGRGI